MIVRIHPVGRPPKSKDSFGGLFRRIPFMRYFPVLLAIVIGTSVSVTLHDRIEQSEQRRLQSEFDHQAENLIISIENSLKNKMDT